MMNLFRRKKMDWAVILVGEKSIQEQFFNDENFNHPERIYWKAEQMPNTPEGTINDVYYLYHLNRQRKIALYFKQAI